MTKQPHVLITQNDVKRYREKLLKEQKGIDPITKQEVVRPALDHCHQSQRTRGVLSSTVNVFLGCAERAYAKYIKWWCSVPLPDLLEGMAEYLRLPHKEVFHPSFIKKLLTEFNKRTANQQIAILQDLGLDSASNSTKRKEILKTFLKKGYRDYDYVSGIIQENTK